MIYFDTNVFHAVANALQAKELPAQLRDQIVLSPITAMEVLSTLTLRRADEMLKEIHSLRSWLNPERAGILPWPETAIARLGFESEYDDDNFTERLADALNHCLAAETAEPLKEAAGHLKTLLDEAKNATVATFAPIIESARKEKLTEETHKVCFVTGLANRVKIKPDTCVVDAVIHRLSAYYEFEREKLSIAVANHGYKPENHKNDLLDAQQLVYLGDSTLHFLTIDKGFARVKDSPQKGRLHVIKAGDLADAAAVENLLRHVLG